MEQNRGANPETAYVSLKVGSKPLASIVEIHPKTCKSGHGMCTIPIPRFAGGDFAWQKKKGNWRFFSKNLTRVSTVLRVVCSISGYLTDASYKNTMFLKAA